MRENEANQRSGFQFELFKLNLIMNGVLVAFALNQPEEWSNALLACPFISFILFSLWFHHALAIKLDPTDKSNSSRINPRSTEQVFRRFSFSLAIISNFIFIPLSAILLYNLKECCWLFCVDIIILVIIMLLYIFWFRLQYHNTPYK